MPKIRLFFRLYRLEDSHLNLQLVNRIFSLLLLVHLDLLCSFFVLAKVVENLFPVFFKPGFPRLDWPNVVQLAICNPVRFNL